MKALALLIPVIIVAIIAITVFLIIRRGGDDGKRIEEDQIRARARLNAAQQTLTILAQQAAPFPTEALAAIVLSEVDKYRQKDLDLQEAPIRGGRVRLPESNRGER